MTEATPERFEKFTKPAVEVLKETDKVARELHNPGIGTELLLLGLVREGSVVSHLAALGIDPTKIEDEVERLLEDQGKPSSKKRYLTKETKDIIRMVSSGKYSLSERERTPQDILTAMIAHGNNRGIDIIKKLSAPRSLREAWAEIINRVC